jgi:site-specific DNA-methyltransferase (adenine-specific)
MAERCGTTHPTAKSLRLMRWLVRLVTPKGGIVLDPFAGSGTTLVAAEIEGMKWIGFEKEREYWLMARKRLDEMAHVKPEDDPDETAPEPEQDLFT